jgi:hypothetical protein
MALENKPQDKADPASSEFGFTVAAIGFAAAVLGLICLYDAIREALGAYQYHTAIPLLSIYKAVLGIYVAARQGHQWHDPKASADHYGHILVFLWIAAYPVLFLLELGKVCDCPPIQPVDLNNTLNWVIGFYFFGKASSLARVNGYRPLGLGKTLDSSAPGGASAPPPAQRQTMEVLRLGAEVLGMMCVYDDLREGMHPPYQSFIDIHYAYRVVLAAYVGANQWRKWTDPKADSQRMGFAWVLLWVGAAGALKWFEAASPEHFTVMPAHLAGDMLCVFSIYGLGKFSDLARKSGYQPFGLGRQTLPAPAPEPQAEAEPEPEEGIEEAEGMPEHLEIVSAACEQAGEFSLQQMASATNLSYETVRHWVQVMIRRGWVEKVSHGIYRWKGRGQDA